MAGIDDIEIPALLFDERASAPDTPAEGLWGIYFKSDGVYIVDDAGTETGPLGTGGGRGGGGETLLDSYDVSEDGTTATITFSSLSQDHRDLMIEARLRGDDSGATSIANIQMGNGTVDSGTNYDWSVQPGGASHQSGSGDSKISLFRPVTGSGAAAGELGWFRLWIFRYTVTDYPRQTWLQGHMPATNYIGSGRWTNTADAIDTVAIINGDGGSWALGEVNVYGIN